jgi:hypothetical protein
MVSALTQSLLTQTQSSFGNRSLGSLAQPQPGLVQKSHKTEMIVNQQGGQFRNCERPRSIPYQFLPISASVFGEKQLKIYPYTFPAQDASRFPGPILSPLSSLQTVTGDSPSRWRLALLGPRWGLGGWVTTRGRKGSSPCTLPPYLILHTEFKQSPCLCPDQSLGPSSTSLLDWERPGLPSTLVPSEVGWCSTDPWRLWGNTCELTSPNHPPPWACK